MMYGSSGFCPDESANVSDAAHLITYVCGVAFDLEEIKEMLNLSSISVTTTRCTKFTQIKSIRKISCFIEPVWERILNP